MTQLYETDFLMDRLFKELESKVGNKKKFSMKKPAVEKINRKTWITNFMELCSMLNREKSHFQNFIEKELNVESSLNESNMLILDKMFLPEKVYDVVNKYAKKYVVCKEPECKSGNTEIVKENRIQYLVCHSCKSRKAIED